MIPRGAVQGLTNQLGTALGQSVSQGANVGTLASAVSSVGSHLLKFGLAPPFMQAGARLFPLQ